MQIIYCRLNLIKIRSQFRIILPVVAQHQPLLLTRRQRTQHSIHQIACLLTSSWMSQQHRPRLPQLQYSQLRLLQWLLLQLHRKLPPMHSHQITMLRLNYKLNKLLTRCRQSSSNSSKPRARCLARIKLCKQCNKMLMHRLLQLYSHLQ